MAKFLTFIGRGEVMAAAFVLTMAIGFAFGPISNMMDGKLLDEAIDGQSALTILNSYSLDQKTTHFWATLILDTIYPASLALFIAGIMARFAGTYREGAVLLPLMAFMVDMAENIVQLMALSGNSSLLSMKTFLTPAKFILFQGSAFVALMAALISLGLWLWHKVQTEMAEQDSR